MNAKQKMAAFIKQHSGATVEVTKIGNTISLDGDTTEVQKAAAWLKGLNSKITANVEIFPDDPEWAFVNLSIAEFEALRV